MAAPVVSRGSRRRPEALSLGWVMLSATQRMAVEDVSSWMLDALASLDARARAGQSRSDGAGVDVDRRSQIAFIDGDRGTGKTSILLTLRAITHSAAPLQKVPDPVERLRACRSRIQWLETLDMEPLSRGTNLFAAILARVAAMVDHAPSSWPPMATALADTRGGFEETTAALQQLQNDAAIVWDRIDSGAPDGDPQVRALWVNQAEKAALDMHGRIAKVMDGVARLLSLASGQEMLFVVPVDDFDLAPAHCLELLRLIRMITTPRLVFVVAGNIRVAETVLRLKSEGDLSALAGSGAPRTKDLLERASEIAANNMRKLVPPGQRAILRELTLNEALGLGKDTAGTALREALALVNFESNQTPPTRPLLALDRFLLLDQPTEAPATAADWFAGTPRQVLDQIAMLEDIAHRRPAAGGDGAPVAPSASDAAKEELDDATVIRMLDELRRQIREEWRVPISERDQLIENLDMTVAGRVDFSQIQVVQDYGVLQIGSTFDLGRIERASAGRFRVSLRPKAGEAPTQNTTVPVEGPLLELPRRVGTGLLLMHDVVTSIWGGYLRNTPLPYASRGRVGPLVRTVWQHGGGETWDLAWPMPEWWTFRDIERFERHFVGLAGPTGGDWGAAWLAALLSVYLDEPPEPSNRSGAQGRIDAMVAAVLAETPLRTARRVLRNSVLCGIALMLAPEFQTGLTLATLKKSGQTLLALLAGDDLARLVRAARGDLCRRILQSEADDYAALTALTLASPQSGLRRILDRLANEIGQSAALSNIDLEAIHRLLQAGAITPRALNTALDRLEKQWEGEAAPSPLVRLARSVFERATADPLNASSRGALVPGNDEMFSTRNRLTRRRR